MTTQKYHVFPKCLKKNVSPNDFFFFSKIKNRQHGQRFQSTEEAVDSFKNTILTVPKMSGIIVSRIGSNACKSALVFMEKNRYQSSVLFQPYSQKLKDNPCIISDWSTKFCNKIIANFDICIISLS